MKAPLLAAGLIIAGLVSGAAAAVLAIQLGGNLAGLKAGQWRTSKLAGAQGADLLTRAVVARTGLLALSREETLYYTRAVDDAGQALDARCTYRLRGKPLPARWWSYTLYDDAHFLARNQDGAPSIDATRAQIHADGSFEAIISPTPSGSGAWISSRGAQRFDLTARLYNPVKAVQADPSKVALASITKLTCDAEASP